MKRIVLFLLTNLAVMLVLGVTASLFGLNRYIGPDGIDFGSLMGFALLMGFGGAFISLLISKPMAKWTTGARVIDITSGAQEARVVMAVQKFADKAGIGMPEVAIFEGEPNAFATGAFKNSALVAVSTGLLKEMSFDEVEAVIAHEVAHIANNDMVTMTLLQGVMNTFVVFLSRVIGYAVDKAMQGDDDERPAGTGIGYMITTMVLDLVLGILASTVVAWFSRQREFRADSGASQLMGSATPMIKALTRLSSTHTADLPKSVAAFGIASGPGRWFSTHPTLDARIVALKNSAVLIN